MRSRWSGACWIPTAAHTGASRRTPIAFFLTSALERKAANSCDATGNRSRCLPKPPTCQLIRRLGEDLYPSSAILAVNPGCCIRAVCTVARTCSTDAWRRMEFAAATTAGKLASRGVPRGPGEADGGRHRGRIRQPWYPVVEAFGAMFAYLGPPEKQPLFPIFSCFEGLREDEEIVATWFSCHGEISPFPLDHNWTRSTTIARPLPRADPHSLISGNQFLDPRLTTQDFRNLVEIL